MLNVFKRRLELAIPRQLRRSCNPPGRVTRLFTYTVVERLNFLLIYDWAEVLQARAAG